jgi:hypothetical protein
MLLRLYVLLCITEVKYLHSLTILPFRLEDLHYMHYNIFFAYR